ncbi:hypothetical protein OU426_10650 [Frigidibacter sp. RF13]|uniref:DUF1127 domain-containing protein n=1 Tax=Frigidibacter sp. RF13 TaxID=2997340 RepID=UPI00226FABB2|nr:DUF1127 domain-containing protein [Frigidibacter sp. RF13]MCY1127311.1 hypothetical protein [Frigidibacter sp. RF13]
MPDHTSYLARLPDFLVLTPRRMARALARAIALSRQRRVLKDLEAHRLADLGLDPNVVAREVARRAWDAPDHWQK